MFWRFKFKDIIATDSIKTELDKMLPEYYELRGWTSDGVPTNETLDRVGI